MFLALLLKVMAVNNFKSYDASNSPITPLRRDKIIEDFPKTWKGNVMEMNDLKDMIQDSG